MTINLKSLILGSTLLTCANLAVAASTAEDIVGTFQWTGTVPVYQPGTNWKIINSGVIDHLAGTVTFNTAPGGYEITDSSELRFQVVDGANSDAAATSFDYQLTSLRFSSGGGFMSDANGEFTVTGDGADLNLNDTVNKAGSEVSLKLKTSAATNAVDAGDEVVIQAVILINNQV